jgi:hypothetical protein
MKSEKLFDKITLFSDIVKIILAPFWQTRNASRRTAGSHSLRSAGYVRKTLMRQRLDFIRSQGFVVDTNVVDQAGEEIPCFEIIAGTDA